MIASGAVTSSCNTVSDARNLDRFGVRRVSFLTSSNPILVLVTMRVIVENNLTRSFVDDQCDDDDDDAAEFEHYFLRLRSFTLTLGLLLISDSVKKSKSSLIE